MRVAPHFGRNLVIVVALVAAGFFGAYLRFLPYLDQQAAYTDGNRQLELSEVERLRFALWDEAMPLSPAVNTPDTEGRPALSPDGQHLVFAVGTPGLNVDLWVADLVDGEPVDARPLARVNTTADELSPAFSADALWFASDRAGGRGGLDLWRVPYTDGVFGFVEAPLPGLNSPADETDPAPVPGSTAIAFASDLASGPRHDFDLWLAVPPAEPVPGREQADARGASDAWHLEPLAPLNTRFQERDPFFTAGGRGLLFASDRSDGEGGFDLWHSVRSVAAWQPPEALAGVNTAADERGPCADAAGFSLLLTVGDEHDGGDLYRARSVELFRLPGRPVGWLDLTILGLLLLLALLAWLGRRWEALDILYKCLLISLLVHLALMWWFREVYPEAEPVDVEQSGPTFKVRLAPSQRALARTRERGGALDVARTEESAPTAPGRAELDTPTIELPATAAPGQLTAPSTASADPPGRQATEASPTARSAENEVALQDRVETGPTRQGEAPALRVVAATGPESPSTGPLAGRPSRRVTADATAGAAAFSESFANVTAASALAMPQVGRASGLPSAHTPIGPPERRRQGSNEPVAVNLAGPRPAPAAPSGGATEDAPELSLGSLLADAGSGAPERGAVRPEQLSPTRTQASGTGTNGDAAHRELSGTPAGTNGTNAAGAAKPGRSTPLAVPLAGGLSGNGPSLPMRSSTTGAGDGTGNGTSDGSRDNTARSLPGIELRDAGPAVPTEPVLADSGDRADSPLEISTLGLVAAASPSRVSRGPGQPQRFGAPSTVAAPPTRRATALPGFTPLALAMAAPTDLPPLDLPGAETTRWEHTPYRTRFGEARLRALEEHGGSDKTEKAVRDGLAYLANIQDDEGYWGDVSDFDDKYGRVTIGKTALCLLAFLGAGHTPTSDTEYSQVTQRAVSLLLLVQDQDTGHYGYSTSYGHAVSTYALAECYALTDMAELRGSLDKAVTWIQRHQNRNRNDERMFGGWGYYYPDGKTFDRWPRSSITAWQVMALESARLGGLEVPDQVFADARSFLRAAHRPQQGVVLYAHDPARLRTEYWTLPGSTPAALFALSLLGEDIKRSRWSSTLDYVMERRPAGYRMRSRDAFVTDASGNLYFWYYGSLALFRHGGDEWDTWNQALQDTLLPAQQANGSWRPISVYADYAQDTEQSRAYTTAMCVLTLEVYYRYFTPLLQVR